jgi:hypothetical protein
MMGKRGLLLQQGIKSLYTKLARLAERTNFTWTGTAWHYNIALRRRVNGRPVRDEKDKRRKKAYAVTPSYGLKMHRLRRAPYLASATGQFTLRIEHLLCDTHAAPHHL